MFSVAELRTLEGSVVAVARGLTAELRTDATGAAITFESVTGAVAYVRVDDVDASTDVVTLCPAHLDADLDDVAA